MYLIVGLGNPGKEYEKTRHNAGFMMLDAIAQEYAFDEFQDKKDFHCAVSEGRIGVEKVLLIKPMTYMNLSGTAVQSVMHFYKIPLEHLCVIYDDVDIPIGTIRIRKEGRPGTHNGMGSVVEHVGTNHFARIRIGIQPFKQFRGDLSDFVLGKFTEDETVLFHEQFNPVVDAVKLWIEGDIEGAMQKNNKK